MARPEVSFQPSFPEVCGNGAQATFSPFTIEAGTANNGHRSAYIHPTQFKFILEFGTNQVLTPRRKVDREKFGPGSAGQDGYYLFMYGKGCEVIINEEGDVCGEEPQLVLDFDLPLIRDCEHTLICSEEHKQAMMSIINNEYKKIGKGTAFGTNGWGRS